MKKEFDRYLTAEMAGLTLILAMTVYAIMNLYLLPNISGELNGLKIFDVRNMGYNFYDAQEIMNNLSVNGARIYKTVYIPLDFIFSILFAIFGYQTYYIYSRWVSIHKVAFYIPCLIIIFDLIKNIGIQLILHDITYSKLIMLTSCFTIAKNISMLAFVLTITILSLFVLITKSVEKI